MDKPIGNGNIFSKSFLPDIGDMAWIDFANKKVFSKECYAICKRFLIGASATVDIVMDPTGCTKYHIIMLPFLFSAYGAGPIFIDVYSGPTVTPVTGTIWDDQERYHGAGNPPELIFTLNPTITDPGTKMPPEFSIFSNGTAAIATTGGQATENLICKLNVSAKYLFRLINQEGNQAYAHAGFNWLEFDKP